MRLSHSRRVLLPGAKPAERRPGLRPQWREKAYGLLHKTPAGGERAFDPLPWPAGTAFR